MGILTNWGEPVEEWWDNYQDIPLSPIKKILARPDDLPEETVTALLLNTDTNSLEKIKTSAMQKDLQALIKSDDITISRTSLGRFCLPAVYSKEFTKDNAMPSVVDELGRPRNFGNLLLFNCDGNNYLSSILKEDIEYIKNYISVIYDENTDSNRTVLTSTWF